MRERLDHIDPASLPTVEDARATQREKYPTHEAARAAWEGRDTTPAPTPAREPDKPTQAQEAERQPATLPRSTEDRVQENWRKQRDAEVARVTEDKPTRTVPSPLRVSDAATGVVDLLGSFVDGLLGSTPPRPVEGIEKIREQRRALAALESIRESMERGEDLSASDVAKLTPTHLGNIKLRGDDYIRQMIESLERDRERERDYGRTRER